jgi:hypothetical protein
MGLVLRQDKLDLVVKKVTMEQLVMREQVVELEQTVLMLV